MISLAPRPYVIHAQTQLRYTANRFRAPMRKKRWTTLHSTQATKPFSLTRLRSAIADERPTMASCPASLYANAAGVGPPVTFEAITLAT